MGTLVTEQIASKNEQDWAHIFVNDHMCTLLDAELNWLDRTISLLRSSRVTMTRTAHP